MKMVDMVFVFDGVVWNGSGADRDDVVVLLMIRRPPRSTLDRSSAASDVYKRQWLVLMVQRLSQEIIILQWAQEQLHWELLLPLLALSLIHISDPTRPY